MARKPRPGYEAETAKLDREDASRDVARDNELADLRNLLADPAARRFLWRLLEKGRMFSDPFSTNAALMGYQCGNAGAARFIYSEIMEADSDAWLLMQQEAFEAVRTRAAIEEADAARAAGESDD